MGGRWRLVALVVALLAGVACGGPAAPGAWRWLDPTLPGVLDTRAAQVTVHDRGHARIRYRAQAGSGTVTVRLAAAPDERFFGLGERFGRLDLRGQLLRNWTADGMGRPGVATTYSPMPFLLSERGYAVHLDTTADATIDLRAPDAVTVEVAAQQVDMEVFTGPDPATVIRRHAAAVGLPPVPPAWGLGVWKSLIGGGDRVRADTDALLAAGVPLDAVWAYDVLDPGSGMGWPWQVYGPTPPGPYPDPAGLVADLHRRGLAVLGYLTPFLVPGRPGYAEAAARGFLVTRAGGVATEPWLGGERRAYVDLTNPDATAWWQNRVRHGLAVTGFDGAMQDYGEDAPADGRYASGEAGALVHNDYPVRYAVAVREAAQSVKPDATVFFARSGYTGSQAVATGRFTGDQTRDWDARTGLPSVLAGMLNGGLSGWPYWGPDIGGFLDGSGARDRELWDRWVQLGALSPVMRDMLGAQADPVGVHTDAATLATFRGYARLHRSLVPYLHGLAEQAHATGLPLLRPLRLADPGDAAAWAVEDECLLGPYVLVAPVMAPGVRNRAVRLPPGRWRDYWTGRVAAGGTVVMVAAPPQQVPLFVRDGSRPGLPAPESLGLPVGQ